MANRNYLKLFLVVSVFINVVYSSTIQLVQCDPPHVPLFGNYGPKLSEYEVGDSIHYYCDTDTYIGGSFYRRCEDTGEWSAETPVCDPPAEFASVNQSSTLSPEDFNNAEYARDGIRSTCTSTGEGEGQYWIGMLKNPGELIRVMIFMPKGDVSYDVTLLKQNGETMSCGVKNAGNDRLSWEFHNCPGPHNRDAIGIQIKSTSSRPLQICEIMTQVLTPPSCNDPRVHIDNGHLQLTRKTASLICDKGFSESRHKRLDCLRDGVWSKKSLYCLEIEREREFGFGVHDLPDIANDP